MKGEIVIKADGKSISVEGNIGFRGYEGRYELIHVLAKCLGVVGRHEWADCILYCLAAEVEDEGKGEFERTEIVIPAKRENEND